MEFSSYRRAVCSWLRLVLTPLGVYNPYPGPTHLDGICLFFLSHIDRAIFVLACENIRFSSLFAAGDVSRGGTSETQRQTFHTDDANQCLHNKPGSHGICPVLLVFWSILVKCCVHLPTSSSKTQILLLEKTLFHKY